MSQEWYLTIGSGVLEIFKNKETALNKMKLKHSWPMFHLIDDDHYLMGNMHLIPKNKLKYCN